MKFLSKKAVLHCGVAAMALTWATGVLAQQAAATNSGTSIETVVVTAEKRSESTQNVAGEVTALTAAALDQIHANSFSDFARTVPGVSYFSGGPTNNLIAIRGITTGGTQLGSAVGIYLDDVPVGASTQFGLGSQSFNINVFDLDRVEILNGPQGTLYGSNALGGTVKYVTAAPDLNSFGASAEVEGSSTEHGSLNDGLRAMVNMPLFDGKAAIRVDGLQQYDSGYTQDPDHGRKDVGSGRTLGGRVSFLAQITPDIDVRLSAYSQSIDGSGADVSFRDFTTHKPVEGPYDQSYVLKQPGESSLSLYSAVLNWNLHWANLTSVTGYQYNHGRYLSDESELYDALLASPDPFGLPVNTSTKKFTQEVRLASPDNNTFEWVIGGYYDREITDESVDLIDAATPSGTLFGVLPFFGYLPSTYRELAAFADGTYFFSDKFDVTLGVRYSQQHQTYQSNLQSLFFPNPFVINHYAAGSDQNVATYLINPRYHVTDDTMIYARISSGFRPGGPNFVLPGGALPPSFQPDKLWNYELGEKSTLLDGKATFNFDVYDIEWTGIQTTVNAGGINQLVNAGNARVQGAEMSFGYRILPDLTVSGSAAYTDAKLITTSPIIGVNYKGARLPLSPKFNFALNANYSFEIGDGFSGAVNASDAYLGDRTAGYAGSTPGVGNPVYKLAGYNTLDLGLAIYMPRNMEVDAYLKNVFDVRGEVSASTINNQYLLGFAPVPVYLSQPRTIGLILKVSLD
jgi:iron complex outermembrane receptor protein